MITTIIKIISIFLIIFIGYFGEAVKLFPDGSYEFLSKGLIYITSPAMLITSILSVDFTMELAKISLLMVGCCLLLYTAMPLIGYFIAKKVVKVDPPRNAGVVAGMYSSTNSGFIGMSLANILFTGIIPYLMAINIIVMTVLLFSLGSILIGMGSENAKKPTFKSVLKELTNPNIIASVIGIIMLVLGIKVPLILDGCLTNLSNAVLPNSMLMLGIMLRKAGIGAMLKDRKIREISFIKVLGMPVLFFFVFNFMPLPVEVKAAIIFASCLPSAAVVSSIAVVQGADGLYTTKLVSLTSFISIITIPLVGAFLTSFYGL